MAFHNVFKVLSFLFFTRYLQINFVRGQPQVPCHFIFGDSLADPGNNNNLVGQPIGNYPPYGVDFVNGPTGRFTNNRTIVDIIGQFLGFTDFTPPFSNSSESDILKGVNYASGGSGISNDTGILEGVITFNQQLANHMTIVLRIIGIFLNETAARELLGRCIYTVITGNNDYINNYFLPVVGSITSTLYTPQQFADMLALQFDQQLRTLYSLGARKVAVFGVGPIGLTPQLKTWFGGDTSNVEAIAQLFRDKVPPLVNTLNSQLAGARFTFLNYTGISQTSPGIDLPPLLDLNRTCCPTIGGLCAPLSTPCTNRSAIGFFDGYHPTDVFNVILAGRAYNKTLPLDASPYDIRQLALLP